MAHKKLQSLVEFGTILNRGFCISSLLLFFLASAVHAQSGACDRIVSISPSVTETLFSVGLGDRIVGVSRYDTYPKQVKSLPSVGGLLDPNLETIVSLKPAIVVGLREQKDVLDKLIPLHIPTATLEHRSLSGVLKSFSEIQQICNSDPSVARQETALVANSLNELKNRTSSLDILRVVVVVYREYDAPHLKDVYLSGNDGYYSDLLGYVGAKNIFSSPTGSLSTASIEGLLQLDPDAILEVLPPNLIKEKGEQALLAPWKEATLLRAVRGNKVFLLDDDWATIPGPRVTVLAKKLFSILHGVSDESSPK